MKKSKLVASIVTTMALSFCLAVGGLFVPTTSSAVNTIGCDVNAFYTNNGEKLTGTADWESKSSGSGISYSQFAKQGIVWNYDKGDVITYDGLIDLTDNKINDDRNLADSIFEGYGMWCSTFAQNQAEWGSTSYETQLTFRFEDYLNAENYFDIIVADNNASYGYIAAKAKAPGLTQAQKALRWGGPKANTRGLVPADGLNVSSSQTAEGWGYYYKMGLAGYDANCINLSYNVQENAAFARAFWGDSDYLCYIRDFGTDRDGKGAWAGFNDASKVKLKIICDNGHGSLLIKSVDGKSLAYEAEVANEKHLGYNTFVDANGKGIAKSTYEYNANENNANGVNLSAYKNRGVVVDYKAGETFTYNKTLNLSDNDSTSLLFEAYGLKVNEKSTSFSVVFTDKNNPSEYFEVKMEETQLSGGWDPSNNKKHADYIAAIAKGVTQGGYVQSKGGNFIGDRSLPAMFYYQKQADGSYVNATNYLTLGWSYAPFVGLNGNTLDTIRLFYDKQLNAIFYEAKWLGNPWTTLICLRDFDGANESATWAGFTNASEVTMTIKGNTGSGSLLVMNVDGESLIYDENTSFSGNYDYEVGNAVENAVCNVDYAIPSISAKSFISNETINDAIFYVKVGNDKLGAYTSTLTNKNHAGTYDIEYYADEEYTTLVAKSSVTVGHNYGTLIAETPKTCTTNGTIAHYECACGKLFNAEKVEVTDLTITAGHEYGTLIAETPKTCTENGTIAHYECSVCHKNFNSEKEEVTDLTITAGHEYGTLIAETPKTCTTNGTIAHYECSVCNKTFNSDKVEVTDLTITAGHEYGTLIAETPKTCTENGTIAHYECSECHKNFNSDKVEVTDLTIAAGHEYGELIPEQPKTCKDDGVMAHYECSECGKTFNADKQEVDDLTTASGIALALGTLGSILWFAIRKKAFLI